MWFSKNSIFTNILTTPNAQLYKSLENLFIIFELNFSHQKKQKLKTNLFSPRRLLGTRTQITTLGPKLTRTPPRPVSKDKNVIWICSVSVEYPISIFNHLVFFFLPSYLTQTRVSFFYQNKLEAPDPANFIWTGSIPPTHTRANTK